MQRLTTVLLVVAIASASGGCVASRKFVRGEVKTSSDELSGRINTDEGNISELKDGVAGVRDSVKQVNGKVTQLDATTGEHTQQIGAQNQQLVRLNGDVQTLDQKNGQVKATADRAAGQVTILDGRFENRNQFTVTSTKAVLFGFDKAKLDPKYHDDLDEVAKALSSNPNAIVVLEGRTDSAGNKDYNVQLGERRMETVKRYLAIEKSVPIYRIHEISLGADRPIVANDSKDGRQQNRAVTLTLLVPVDNSGDRASTSRQ
jgi:outer membrane protein OmpA-like peptidoglycan-associated protein